MGWLTKAADAVVSFFSPEKGAERIAWRGVQEDLEAQRSYDAGHGGRLNAHWNVINQPADWVDRADRDIIRARARDLERNSDIMNSLLWARVRNVVGAGFTLQAQTDNEKLNEEIETLWAKWCKARNCDVTGTQSLTQMLRTIVTRKTVDGGILIVQCMTRDGMLPFSLQLVEVDELETMQLQPKDKRNRVIGGIEYNAYNRPQGYWIRKYSLDGMTLQEPQYIPADKVIFYYKRRRPSQLREMSDMAPTLSRIRDANEFMTAVAVKQRIEACLSVFIKRALPPTGMGRTGDQERKSYAGKKLSPGMIGELNAGDEVSVVNPTGQSADATSFVKLHQKMVAAGQGLSYEATSRDMSETNYASARQGAIEDELTFAEERESICDLLDEIYGTFVISCWLAGKIDIPDFWENKDKYFKHEWVRAPKPWVDPLKEANATKIALQSGIKTYQQICAENGVDWRDNLVAISELMEYADELGLDIGGVVYDGKLEAQSDEPEPETVIQPVPVPPDAAGIDPDASDGESGDTDGNSDNERPDNGGREGRQ